MIVHLQKTPDFNSNRVYICNSDGSLRAFIRPSTCVVKRIKGWQFNTWRADIDWHGNLELIGPASA